MKHFDKLDCVTITLKYPEQWDSHEIVNEVTAQNRHDLIWEHVCNEINLIPEKYKADNLPNIDDSTIGLNYDESISFMIYDFNSPEHLDQAIEWLYQRMLEGFNTTLKEM